MGLFKRPTTTPRDLPPGAPTAENWAPTIDLDKTRQAVRILIEDWHCAAGGASERMEPLIFSIGRASGTPHAPLQLMKFYPSRCDYQEILRRPWYWVVANASHPANAGDSE